MQILTNPKNNILIWTPFLSENKYNSEEELYLEYALDYENLLTYNTDMTYDANGNLIKGLGKYYEYDPFNQLSSVRKKNATGNVIAEYRYDADGNRIKKVEYDYTTGNNQTTYYISDNFIQIRYTNGTILNETYYYANDKLIVKKDNSGAKTYYHSDHLGSITLVTNQTGNITEEEFYLPFGDVYSGSESSRYLFTAQEFDKLVDIYYYGARYYQASIMRMFISPDSMIANIFNPQNLNHYAYVLNNPYKYIDPNGKEVYLVTRSINNQYANSDILFLRVVSNFVTSHTTHSYFNVIPDNPEDFRGETNFNLGAYASDGIFNPNSILQFGKNVEKTGGTKEYSNVLLNTPEGKTDTEFINDIIAEGNKLNEAKVPYVLNPKVGSSRSNSNVFARTATENAGSSFPKGDLSPWAISPGIDKTYNYDKRIVEKPYNKDKSEGSRNKGCGKIMSCA